MSPTITIKEFSKLDINQLYAILKMRSEIFVVEQNIVYLDPDGYDMHALHVSMEQNGELIAYCRIVPPAIKYPECSIGRIVVAQTRRREGLGSVLIRYAIAQAKRDFPHSPILLDAQAQLEGFYRTLGFIRVGEPFMLEGLMHVRMRLD